MELLKSNPRVKYFNRSNQVNIIWELSDKVEDKIRVSNVFHAFLKDRSYIQEMDHIPLNLCFDNIYCDQTNVYVNNILDTEALTYKNVVLEILEICIIRVEEEKRMEEKMERERQEINELNRKREADLSKLL